MSDARRGRRTRIAMIDSGVNPKHPHVQPIAGGVYITADGLDENYLDLLGHGTAVAGAIREKAPDAELHAVKIFDRELAASGGVLLRALDWCLDHEMDFVNLSLGTLNPAYISALSERVVRAEQLKATIVAAYEMNGRAAFPGSLDGVAGVLLDNACPRLEYSEQKRDGRTLYAAAGFPRNIPGVAPSRNLQGISFAVANVTGLLAAKAQRCHDE